MSRQGYATQDRGAEQNRRRVQQWMMDMGYSVRQEATPGASWVLIAAIPDSVGFAVVQEPTKLDRLVIQCNLDVSQEHQGLLSDLSPAERSAFMWELRFGLLSAIVEFKFDGEPLTRVGVARPLYVDGLTKNTFAHAVQEVRHAGLFVSWKLMQKAENGAGGDLSNIRVN